MPRNWYQNPGQDGTFWVTPFYSTATWDRTSANVTALRNGTNSVPTGTINTGGNFAAPFYIGVATDPLVTVTDGTRSIQVHIPLGAVIESPFPSAGNQNIGGADSTQPYLVWSAQDASFASGSSVQTTGSIINSSEILIFDGSGPVMMDVVTNTSFPAANSFGLIQDYELQQAIASQSYVIQHMLAYSLDPSQISPTPPAAWPLNVLDQGAVDTGPLQQGLTIGIPADVARPAGKTRGFYLLWDCFQQYGGFFYNVAGSGSINLTVFSQRTDSATTALISDIQSSWSSVVAQLCILTNQTGINSIKGFASGATFAFPPPPVLDLSPTNGYVAPSTFGAWYASGRGNYYNALGPLAVPLPAGAFAKSIAVSLPAGLQPATPFTVSVTLQNYSTVPTLTYSDDSGVAVSLPQGSTTGLTSASFQHPGMTSGPHALVVSDGAVSSSPVNYTIATAGWTSLPATTSLTNTVTGLNPSTAYDFQVIASNPIGTSPPSAIATTTTTTQTAVTPTAPTGLTSTAIGTTTVNLAWTAPTTGTTPFTYQTQWSLHGQNVWTNGPSVSTTSAQVSGLTANTSYDFQVSASNAGGTSPFSTILTVSTAATLAPVTWGSPTTNVTLSADKLTATSTGSSSPGASQGGVLSSTSQTAGKWSAQFTLSTITQNISVGLANLSYSPASTDLGADANSTGFYPDAGTIAASALTAIHAGGVVLSPSGTHPGDVNGNILTMLVDVDARLVWWQTPAMVTAYGPGAYNDSVSANPAIGVGGVPIGIAGALFMAFTANEGGDVVTLNGGSSAFVGNSVPSNFNPWGGGTVPVVAPGQVTGLVAGTPTNSAVPLTWVLPSTGTQPLTYTVNFRTTGGGAFAPFGTTNNVTSLTVTGLNASQSYDFQVVASNSAGSGTPSATVTATTAAVAASVPGAPTSVAAGSPTNTTVSVTWRAPSSGGAPTSYQVQSKVHTTSTFVNDPPAESLDGTTRTSTSGSIIDSAGNVWTLVPSSISGLGVAENGVLDPPTANVILLLYWDRVIYQENQAGNWYSMPGGTQVGGDPRIVGGNPVSVSGTTLTSTSGSIRDQAGNLWTLVPSSISGLGVAENGVLDPKTANVTILVYWNGVVYQENQAGNWYSMPGGTQIGGDPRQFSQTIANLTANTQYDFRVLASNDSGSGPPSSPPVSATTTNTSGTGVFHVSSGKILDPSGGVFKARGANMFMFNWPENTQVEAATLVTNNQAQPLTSIFPGINIVRFVAFQSVFQCGLATLSAIQPYVDRLRAAGVVVMIDPHIYPGVLAGSDLTTVANRMADYAAHYLSDSGVWFQTQNEPDPNTGDVNNMLRTIINSIRGTGNKAPIAMCLDSYSGLDTNFLSQQNNLLFDQHFYGYSSNYSTDQGTVNANLQGFINSANAISSADGVIPIVVGEFGTSAFNGGAGTGFTNTNPGENSGWYDNNWAQVLEAVYSFSQNGTTQGYTQWYCNTPDVSQSGNIDMMLAPPFDGSGGLTQGGQALKNAIQAGR